MIPQMFCPPGILGCLGSDDFILDPKQVGRMISQGRALELLSRSCPSYRMFVVQEPKVGFLGGFHVVPKTSKCAPVLCSSV